MGFELRFSDKEITARGGMGIMKRMIDHLGFEAALTAIWKPPYMVPTGVSGWQPLVYSKVSPSLSSGCWPTTPRPRTS